MLFKKKPVFILIHGFGKRKTDEMNYLKSFLSNQPFDVVVPSLFNEEVENNSWSLWVSNAKNAVEPYIKENRDVYVLGFSMGGVIASYIATAFNVKKLILVAPAFEYFTLTTFRSVLDNTKTEEDEKYESLPESFYPIFMEVVNNLKNSIDHITCPTLFLCGTEDEVISPEVSKQYFTRLSIQQKSLVYLQDGKHRLLEDDINGKVACKLILDFIKDELY